MESYASSLPPYRPSGERRTADLLRASSRKDAPSYRMTTRESGEPRPGHLTRALVVRPDGASLRGATHTHTHAPAAPAFGCLGPLAGLR
eukprot:188449-Prymnesium_polylepis.1